MSLFKVSTCDECGRTLKWILHDPLMACWGWKCEKRLCRHCAHGEEGMCRDCLAALHRELHGFRRKEREEARELRGLPERVAVLEYRLGVVEGEK